MVDVRGSGCVFNLLHAETLIKMMSMSYGRLIMCKFKYDNHT